jgi:hypothetical protein
MEDGKGRRVICFIGKKRIMAAQQHLGFWGPKIVQEGAS